MLKKLVFGIFVAFLSSFLCFVLLHFSKGSIAYANGVNSQSKEFVQRIEQNLGLNKPLLEQYKTWLLKALKGDFGFSLLSGEKVLKLIKERLANTLILALSALVLLFSLSVFLALLGLYYQNTFLDKIISFLSLTFFTLPPFALALLLILLFGVFYPILPSSGTSDIGYEDDFLNRLEHLILPILVLVLSHLALFLKITRNALNESFNEIFVLNAFARGLSKKRIYFHLLLKHAISPVIAYFGGASASFIMGTYVIESVFSYAGVGELLVKSIIFKDFPVVLALVFFNVLFVSLCTLTAEFIIKLINVRLRTSYA